MSNSATDYQQHSSHHSHSHSNSHSHHRSSQPSRSHSTRSRPTTTSSAAAAANPGPPPHRSASNSHTRANSSSHQRERERERDHHHSHHSRHPSNSSARPVQDSLPQHDYEQSNVAQHSKRPSSKDRRPPTSRSSDSKGVHRRSSTRSNTSAHRNNHADMAGPTAVANNGGPAAVPPVMQAAADARASGSKQRTTRTSIPTQSGKWILGKTIGAGSMGKVKLARKEDGTEQVSIP